VVRGDVGDLSKAQAIVVVSHMAALIIAPPGSSIDSMAKTKRPPLCVACRRRE